MNRKIYIIATKNILLPASTAFSSSNFRFFAVLWPFVAVSAITAISSFDSLLSLVASFEAPASTIACLRFSEMKVYFVKTAFCLTFW
jgi:hypothetical protein